MANVKKTDENVNTAEEVQKTTNTAEEVKKDEPQSLVEQLMQMQKKLDEKMAALEEREAAVTEKEQRVSGEVGVAAKAPVTSNAWKEMRTIFLPRAHAGEENFVMVGVNGQQWKVPRGKSVEVPLPLFERLEIMLDQEEKAFNQRQRMNEEAERAQLALMRMR